LTVRISLNWLQELVDISMSPEALADLLTMAGFEVEEIEDRRSWADGVVLGRVLDRQQHPNADRLSVCQVDIGQAQPSQIVCGAANVRADIYVAVATLGTYLPKIDLKIKSAKLRGVPSAGMICSLSEVGLTKESEGIHIFEDAIVGSLKPGADARPLLGLEDVVLDVTSTANRADALSLVGIAREISAITGAPLKLPEPTVPDVKKLGSGLNLKISETQACPTYIGTVIEGVKVGPSPMWLQQRLQSSGMRAINNIVDVTNYIMLEWGQPLHAFDRDRTVAIAGSNPLTMGVRFAQAGESVVTLDSQTRNLQEQALMITANDQPVMLAGIMGGEETEVFEGTQNLILEAAIFDAAAIRRSARAQGLRTEASARYERGVNLAELERACRRAIQLITELAGGQVVTQEMTDTRQATLTRSIELRLERVTQVLGLVELEDDLVDLQAADVERTLTALGCQLTPKGNDIWTVTVPPYRYRDLEREVDLIEEVARLYGYNKFCDTLPEKTELGYLSIEQSIIRKLREAFRAAGLTELMHYSLGKPGEQQQIVLANPLFTEFSALRTDLIGGLIDAFQFNLQQGNGALNGFELGHIFWNGEDGLMEAEALGGIIGGDPTQGKWIRGGKDQPLTWFEAKGLLDSAFQGIGLPVEYQPDLRDSRLHPGRTASLWVRGDRLGTFGQLHPQLRQERDLPDEVYVFQLDVDVAIRHLEQEEMMVPIFKAYSSYPASDRDIAFYADKAIAVADLERTITKAGGKLLDTVNLFDEYRGDRVPDGQRSLAFRLVYRADDRTLTDEDVDPVHQKVRDALVEKFRVELRS
jgi:phenylalanyl-tRNA synthetase beta chain